MTEDATARFESTHWMGRLLIILLWILALLGPIALLLGHFERSVLYAIKELSFASQEDIVAAAQTSDRNVMIIGILQLIVGMASIIVWYIWVFRSNKLARALGATTMKYSPGWSVGWFFVPIMSLFKPYFAMKEIYLATMDPRSFDTEQEVEDQPESLNIMKLWWLVYLVDSWLGRIAFRQTMRADTIDELISANGFMFASDISTIIASLTTIWLVREFSEKQQAAYAAAQAVPELTPDPSSHSPSARPA